MISNFDLSADGDAVSTFFEKKVEPKNFPAKRIKM